MTAKRFTYIDGFEDNGEYITPYHVVELLNELHEENEELRKENKRLRDFEYFVFKSIGELNEKKARG